MQRRISLTLIAVLILSLQTQLFAEMSSKARKAEKLAGTGDVNGAIELYKELMAKNPAKNPELVKEGREGIVKCQLIFEKEALRAKRYDESEKILKELMSDYKDTDNIKEAYLDLVLMRTEMGNILFNAGKYDDCVTLMNETKVQAPSDTSGLKNISALAAKALFAAGTKAVETKNYEKALNYITAISREELAKDDPMIAKSSETLSNIGKELLALSENQIKSEKFDDAQKNIDLALTTGKDDAFVAQAIYDTGLVNRLNNQSDKALVSYKDVLSNHKTSQYAPMAAYDMYLINSQRGNKSDALANITAASNLKPDNVEYIIIRAQLMRETGSVEEAKKILNTLVDKLQEQIQKSFVGKEKLQYTLGQVYIGLESYSEAAIELDKAINRNPSYTEARKALAFAQFKEKNYTQASQNYDTLIKQSVSEYDKMRADNSMNAETSPDTALKLERLGEQIAYFHYQNGLCFEQLGDYDKAEQECRLGLEGVSTKEAAATMKRIQKARADKPAKPAPAQPPSNTADTVKPPPAAPAPAVEPASPEK